MLLQDANLCVQKGVPHIFGTYFHLIAVKKETNLDLVKRDFIRKDCFKDSLKD